MTRDDRRALALGKALTMPHALGIDAVIKQRAYDATVHLAGARGLVEHGASPGQFMKLAHPMGARTRWLRWTRSEILDVGGATPPVSSVVRLALGRDRLVGTRRDA